MPVLTQVYKSSTIRYAINHSLPKENWEFLISNYIFPDKCYISIIKHRYLILSNPIHRNSSDVSVFDYQERSLSGDHVKVEPYQIPGSFLKHKYLNTELNVDNCTHAIV